MNYRKIYFKLIKNRRENHPNNCYIENHHIIPKSLGGKDLKTNLVLLTAKEHFIVHYLLTKMFSNKTKKAKMIMAFSLMLLKSENQKRYRFTSRQFQYLRELHSNSIKILQGGTKNSQYGKVWITDGVNNKSISSKNEIPNGWVKGRSIFKSNKLNKKEAKKLETKRNKEKNKEYYNRLYLIYCEKGWNEIAKVYKYSKPNFVSQCEKYVETFKSQNGKLRGE